MYSTTYTTVNSIHIQRLTLTKIFSLTNSTLLFFSSWFRYNYSLLLFSVISLGLSSLLTAYYGAAGFIYANCVNMAMRIYKNFSHIAKFFGEFSRTTGTPHPLAAMFPSYRYLCTLGCVTFIMCIVNVCSTVLNILQGIHYKQYWMAVQY